MSSALAKTEAQEIPGNDLPSLCNRYGVKLRRQGKTFGSPVCIKCGEGSANSNRFCVYASSKDDRWRFKCHSCGIYGDAADFLARAKNITLAQALEDLRGPAPRGSAPVRSVASTPKVSSALEPKPSNEAMERVLSKLKAHAFDSSPVAYLKSRCISEDVIQTALDSGQLRMMPIVPSRARDFLFGVAGREDLEASGLLKPKSDWPAIAFRPIVAIPSGATGAEFRHASHDATGPKAIRYGTMQWPWYFKRKPCPSNVMAVEGFIDTLSVVQMVPEADAIMGIPGVNGWSARWFEALKKHSPDITVLIGFDNNKAGIEGAERLAECLDEVGLRHVTVLPPLGEDWNFSLQQREKFFQ